MYGVYGLFSKLLKAGINGKLYNIIKNMYMDTKAVIKFRNKITHEFNIQKGVKQGCVISPLLFNLFIIDLNSSLDSSQKPLHPALLNDKVITSLFYADDLVLMSQTASGLQNMITVLQNYSDKWKLKIN